MGCWFLKERRNFMFEIKLKMFYKIFVGVDDVFDVWVVFVYVVGKVKCDGSELGIVFIYEINMVNVF